MLDELVRADLLSRSLETLVDLRAPVAEYRALMQSECNETVNPAVAVNTARTRMSGSDVGDSCTPSL